MSITTLFESGLYGRLRQQAGSHWQDYVDHPFLQQLAAGTLPERAFRRYLTQDYLFLLHFARAYALLVSKLRTLPEMRAATASLNGIVAELPLHVAYCAEWGLSEAQIAAQPEAAETMNYTRYVLDIGHAGDALDLLAGLLPCVAGYAEIGLRLLHDPATKMEAILTPPGSATTAKRAIWPACVPPSSCSRPSATSAAHQAASPSWRRFSPPPPSWNRHFGRWG